MALALGSGLLGLGIGLGVDFKAQAGGGSDAGPQAALSSGPLPSGLERSDGIRNYIEDPARDCLATGAEPVSRQQAQLAGLVAVLRHSPLGAELLEHAAGRDVILCLDNDTQLLAYYFPGLRLIGIRESLVWERRVAFLAHELAHVPQHPMFSDSRYLAPRDLLLLRRIREADAEATATRVAWQLAEAGFETVWLAKQRGVYGDLARAFRVNLGDDRGPAAEQRATRATFDRWFSKSWRLDTYDRMTLEHLARLAEDGIGLVPARQRLTDGFLRGIGRRNEENYLDGTEGPALTGPYYRETLSPANAGFLDSVLTGREQADSPREPRSGA